MSEAGTSVRCLAYVQGGSPNAADPRQENKRARRVEQAVSASGHCACIWEMSKRIGGGVIFCAYMRVAERCAA